MANQILDNRYELIERIGGGGMAVVYKAKCHLLNRYVAVKILRDEFTNDEEFVKRFRIEAQSAASLSHPNIVSIFDVGQDDGIYYIVMEYIDGITLKDYINQKGALNWKEAAGIAIQICSAIEQAHKNHIIHRDIKPHNILITKEGIAKVTDFGIARAVSSSTITMVGSTIGSVHYFSPEQARGGFTDEKSDLYSLGITFYEMVTGRVPFDGESPVAVALKHLQDKAEKPSDINPAIPRSINDIIMRLIKKDQNLRYPNASELLVDIQRSIKEPNLGFAGDAGMSNEIPTKKMQSLENVEYIGDDELPEENMEVDMPKKPKDTKNRKDKLSVWLGVITGIIIIAIFVFIGYKVIMPAILPEPVDKFTVGDYVGKDFNMVKDELKRSDITAIEEKRVFSDTIEKGVIISQDIDPNMPLNPGSSIKFQISDGKEMITIPDVVKKEARIAEQNLKDLKLQVTESTEYSDDIATDLVIRTEPGADEQVDPGTVVTLVVSMGPELKPVKVPNLIGLNKTDAEKLILEKNLKIGKITPSDVVSDTALITYQYPLADSEVTEGTAVDLTYKVENTGDNTTTAGSDTSSKPADTQGTKQKYEQWKISLTDPNQYGDEIQVYIESTPSDTNEPIVKEQKYKKSEFPLMVDVPVAANGTTHVVIKLDGIIIAEEDI